MAEGRALAVPSPGAGHLEPPAALAQVVEVELVEVVALDHVGIRRLQRGVERLEQPLLRRIRHRLQQEQLVAAAQPQPDRQHAVARLRGIAEVAALRAGLDVELEPPDVAEGHLPEEPLPVLQQVLALERADRVDRHRRPRLLQKRVVGGEAVRVDQAVEGPLPVQPLEGDQVQVRRRGRVIEPGKGPESVHAVRAAAVGGRDGQVRLAVIGDPESADRVRHVRSRLRTASRTP